LANSTNEGTTQESLIRIVEKYAEPIEADELPEHFEEI